MLGMFAAVMLPFSSATLAPPLAVRDLSPFASLDVAARAVPSGNSVASLAKRLAALAPSPLAKARIAYVWTTSHVRYALTRRPGADATLITGTGDCDAHATLYAALCTAMGVECTRVTGCLRFPYAPEPTLASVAKRLGSGQWLVSHAWNAVRIDGRWGLVDTTLGTPTGTLEPDDYFLPSPDVLATDHVPDDPTRALVQGPSLDKLAKMPLLRPSSWRMGVQATDLIANPGNDGSSVVIHLPWRHDMRVALQTDQGNVEDAALVQPNAAGDGDPLLLAEGRNGRLARLRFGRLVAPARGLSRLGQLRSAPADADDPLLRIRSDLGRALRGRPRSGQVGDDPSSRSGCLTGGRLPRTGGRGHVRAGGRRLGPPHDAELGPPRSGSWRATRTGTASKASSRTRSDKGLRPRDRVPGGEGARISRSRGPSPEACRGEAVPGGRPGCTRPRRGRPTTGRDTRGSLPRDCRAACGAGSCRPIVPSRW